MIYSLKIYYQKTQPSLFFIFTNISITAFGVIVKFKCHAKNIIVLSIFSEDSLCNKWSGWIEY